FDRVESDRPQAQCVPHSDRDFDKRKRLQQSQHLHVLPPPAFPQPSFHLPPQFGELCWQLPALERRRLVQSIGLLLQQGQIVQRVEDHFLTPVTSRVPRNHLARAADHHLPHER